MNTSKERIGIHMPQYHQLPENWGQRGKFTITACPFPRCGWPIRIIAPYHVGDRIKFNVRFEKANPSEHISQVVYEKFRDNYTKQPICDVNGISTEVVGNIIDGEGDVSYYIGYYGNLLDSKPIFTTRVESWDTIFSKWGWVFVGAFFTIICGILLWYLNLIPLNPH